jgi:hypothetical protein
MKRKMSLALASGLGTAFLLGTFAQPASAAPRSCISQYNAYVQAQEQYDDWNNLLWSFEMSAESFYQDNPDGSSQLMVHVDYQAIDGSWVEEDYTDAEYLRLDTRYQNDVTHLANLVAAAENAYATCGQ